MSELGCCADKIMAFIESLSSWPNDSAMGRLARMEDIIKIEIFQWTITEKEPVELKVNFFGA